MKRKIMILALAALAFSVVAYGTIAYFTVSVETENVITAGNVKMMLHDETESGDDFSQLGMSGMMPGDVVDKVVYVENIGDNAFYARIKLINTIEPGNESAAELSFDKVHLDIDTASWTLGTDGWYYYQSPLEKGGKSKPLFTTVAFEPTMDNSYMNAVVEIDVIAQAVQAANNGDTVWQAAGWPAE